MSKGHLQWEAFTKGAFEDYPCVIVWGFTSVKEAEDFCEEVRDEMLDEDDRDYVFFADGAKYGHFGTWVVGLPIADALADLLAPKGRVYSDR